MADSRSGLSFASDQRGVSAVLGFILLFGILILALATYQAQIVPQENAATEFEHFQDVRDEMVGIRNSISTAGQADVSQFSDLTLGTNYQTRTFTINPPPPGGTLQTSDKAYNITIANETDSTNVSTRFLEYQPGYFEIDIGSIWYEHSVLYLDERDQGNGVSIIEDQNILNDRTVRITALQNRFREGGTKRIALELYPQEDLSEGDGTFPIGSDLTVTIPTRLDNETYWDDELGGKDGYEGVDINARAEGIHALNLSVDSDNIEVNTVGVRSDPDEEPAKNIDPITSETLNDLGPDSDLDLDPETDLPDGFVAFLDENENGEYNGNEGVYTVADLDGLSVDGRVIVSKDVVMEGGDRNGVSIDADRIVVEDGVELRTNQGNQNIELISQGKINIDSVEMQSAKGITIDAGEQLSANGASLEASGGSTVKLRSSGDMNIDSADINSAQTITIDAGEQLSATSVNIEGTRGGSSIKLLSSGDMNIDSADINSAQTITIDAGEQLSAIGVNIEGTGGGSSIKLRSSGDMNIDSADINSAQTITIDPGGELSDNNANY